MLKIQFSFSMRLSVKEERTANLIRETINSHTGVPPKEGNSKELKDLSMRSPWGRPRLGFSRQCLIFSQILLTTCFLNIALQGKKEIDYIHMTCECMIIA